jgi:hypothetical protein
MKSRQNMNKIEITREIKEKQGVSKDKCVIF